ncbi:MAG: hypothetical protein WBD41_17720 [Rhodococcus sp. (in: high G+C Gram-positive bacteria)]
MRRTTSRHPAVTDLLHDRPTASTSTPSRTTRRNTGQGPRRTVLIAGAAVIAVGAGVAVAALTTDDTTTAANTAETENVSEDQDSGLPALNLPTAAAETTAATTTSAPAAASLGDDCAADRGDQKSGAGVIKAFQYAYYIRRDGAAARALATPRSSVLDAAALQSSIDAVPPGSTYCLAITDVDPAIHLARMTVLQPNQPPDSFIQTITTENVGGTWFVATFQQ